MQEVFNEAQIQLGCNTEISMKTEAEVRHNKHITKQVKDTIKQVPFCIRVTVILL